MPTLTIGKDSFCDPSLMHTSHNSHNILVTIAMAAAVPHSITRAPFHNNTHGKKIIFIFISFFILKTTGEVK